MSTVEQYQPLSRAEMKRVVAGQGCASRIPVLFHIWTYPGAFQDTAVRDAVQTLLDTYPCDAQLIPWCNIKPYDAPADDPQFRWMPTAAPGAASSSALDAQCPLADWADLDAMLADFPNPDYPGLFPQSPVPDGRYRIAHWWYTLFERHWSLRGMTNALMDYYTNPDEVHRLFRALTDFYLRVIERAKTEEDADAIYSTDDLGTQTSTFFSPAIFDEFYAPYYRELIDRAHALDMHYWLHTCGNVTSLLPRFIDLGLDVIHPIQKHAMHEEAVVQQFGGQIAFWAGFDVQQIIPYGSPADVRQEVRHLIDTYARHDGRFLLTAGNGITGDTPLESLRALFAEAYRYGTGIVQTLK